VRFDDVAARLTALPDPLPLPADILMPVLVGGPEVRPSRGLPPQGLGRPAAVLVLVFPDDAGDARVVLIERARGDGHHSGEVSFPGGKVEWDDHDETAAALREAAEEVGLDPSVAGVRIAGVLDRFWIPVSDFAVTPVLALADRRPAFVPSPAEVARVVEAPLDGFLPDARIEIVERTVRDWPLRYGAYEVEGLSVWGATARVLSQLGAVIAAR
jgi:8-oxo-dGTP pyrophosphatase MutT (NUDIX family)